MIIDDDKSTTMIGDDDDDQGRTHYPGFWFRGLGPKSPRQLKGVRGMPPPDVEKIF